jgi:hypothetical protein
MSAEDAQSEEARRISGYASQNYRVLNIAKAGGLGGSNVKWTYQNCLIAATKCKSVSEMPKAAYTRCLYQGWLTAIYNALPHLRNNLSKY